MAEYDRPYSSAPEETPARRKWPLAGVMVIDLVIIFVAIVVVTSILLILFIGVRATQQGVPLGANSLSQEETLKLLGTDGSFVILLAQNAIFVLVPVLRVALVRREPLAEIGFQASKLGQLLVLGLGMGVVIYIGNILLTLMFTAIGIQSDQAEQFTRAFSLVPGGTFGQVLFFIGGGLLAPIGEEMLFRGYVFNAIRLTFGSKGWAIPLAYLASSLVFAVIHLPDVTQGAIALIAPIFFIALVLAWGMHRTGSIVPCIIAHSMNNSAALLALLACINNAGLDGCPKL
jgi:membrane protease YdiL (CAAX protease family)